MKMLLCVFSLVFLTAGCAGRLPEMTGKGESMVLKVQWQRLVDDEGNTCDRCGGTQQELGKGVRSLKASLEPLGINVVLEQRPLTREQCAEDISESNRIWIANRPLEDWLGAEVGQSQCGSCCSKMGEEVECRTMSVDGATYEVIPAELIIKAGLLAASQMMGAQSNRECCPSHHSDGQSQEPCCPSQTTQGETHGKCCPEPKKSAAKTTKGPI